MTDVSVSQQVKSLSRFLAPERTMVTSFHRENHDTITIDVKTPDGYTPWQPGQFNMLYLFGIGEVPLSISGSPSNPRILTHTIKTVGAVTDALGRLKTGDSVWLRGPFGQGWPSVPEGHDVLLAAGGIGLAPLRPVVEATRAQNPNARVMIVYGSRTPADLIFDDDLRSWALDQKITLRVTVDRVDPSKEIHPWTGSVGVLTSLLPQLEVTPERTMVMTCGPEIMMRHLALDLTAMGIDQKNIFVSMERNMKCAVGICGRCQWGPQFICRDGPVYSLDSIRRFWNVREF